ncbi:hypothetical protein LOAG_15883, partial [Loa loa]
MPSFLKYIPLKVISLFAGKISKKELTHSSKTDNGRGALFEYFLEQNNLRRVAVHSGQVNGSNYYLFIRPDEDDDLDDVDVAKWQSNKE